MTALTPVSFRKGLQHAPRLSPVRAPGRTSDHFWTAAEDDVIRAHYPTGGYALCQIRLSEMGSGKAVGTRIYQRARHLGIDGRKMGGPRQRRPEFRAPEMDERIRQGWAELRGRGAVQRFADALGVPRHALSQRASQLGLTMPHRKEPPWTAAEESLLPTLPLYDLHRASAAMRALGFHRTAASIQIRCKRLQITRRRGDVLSATGVARILGYDSKTVAAWCIDGSLTASRRGTDRLPQQGGDVWSITPADLRRFVIDNLDRIDIRRVDKHAFVDLLVSVEPGAPPAPAAATEGPPARHIETPTAAPPTASAVRPAPTRRRKASPPPSRSLDEILADAEAGYRALGSHA